MEAAQHIADTIQQAWARIKSNIVRFGDQFPYIGEGLNYSLTDNHQWMTAFWTGQLWLAYALTKDAEFRQAAESHLGSFEQRLINRVDESHDFGFLYSLSARAQYQLTGDQAARQLAIQAAERLSERFRPKGEYIQAWGAIGDPQEGGRLIVDCMMNLPLLFWASHETDNPKFADVALAHARTTLRYAVRPDDTTYHTFFFDQETGEPIGAKTVQGYADNSFWSRGQAWAIYGFALVGDWTGDVEFIDIACHLADAFWKALGDDLIPLWDFQIPPDAPHKRDSSAGAIAACGMWKLASLIQAEDPEFADQLKQRVQRLLAALTEACFETSPEAQGLLRDTSYNVNNNNGVEQFMPFGDYFYLEGLTMLSSVPVDLWGKPSQT